MIQVARPSPHSDHLTTRVPGDHGATVVGKWPASRKGTDEHGGEYRPTGAIRCACAIRSILREIGIQTLSVKLE